MKRFKKAAALLVAAIMMIPLFACGVENLTANMTIDTNGKGTYSINFTVPYKPENSQPDNGNGPYYTVDPTNGAPDYHVPDASEDNSNPDNTDINAGSTTRVRARYIVDQVKSYFESAGFSETRREDDPNYGLDQIGKVTGGYHVSYQYTFKSVADLNNALKALADLGVANATYDQRFEGDNIVKADYTDGTFTVSQSEDSIKAVIYSIAQKLIDDKYIIPGREDEENGPNSTTGVVKFAESETWMLVMKDLTTGEEQQFVNKASTEDEPSAGISGSIKADKVDLSGGVEPNGEQPTNQNPPTPNNGGTNNGGSTTNNNKPANSNPKGGDGSFAALAIAIAAIAAGGVVISLRKRAK